MSEGHEILVYAFSDCVVQIHWITRGGAELRIQTVTPAAQAVLDAALRWAESRIYERETDELAATLRAAVRAYRAAQETR